MDPNAYGLVEMAFSFGAVLIVLGWQWVSVRRSIREDEKRKK